MPDLIICTFCHEFFIEEELTYYENHLGQKKPACNACVEKALDGLIDISEQV